MTDIYIDIETTGFSPTKNDPIEIAMIAADNFVIKETFMSKVRPTPKSFVWSYKAEEIHGYTYDEVAKFIPSYSVCVSINKFLSKNFTDDNNRLICHALPYKNGEFFDSKFIKMLFQKNNCSELWPMEYTKKESTIVMGRNAGHKENNLKAWAERIGFNLEHHDPMSDALCCMEIHKYLGRD